MRCFACLHKEQERGTGLRKNAIICSHCKKTKKWLIRPTAKLNQLISKEEVKPKEPRDALFSKRTRK